MTAPDATPVSAARVAELLGDSLPDPADDPGVGLRAGGGDA